MHQGCQGPWAVIVGGSEGIGLAFAKALADQHLDLVLVGRRTAALQAAADELRTRGNVVRCISADLATDDGLDALISGCADLEVGTLVYNAGVGDPQAFKSEVVDGDLPATRALIALNTVGLVTTCRHFGVPMRARGCGSVLIVGSFSGLVGSPGVAVYAASKSFGRIFAEGFWREMRPYGVEVLHYLVSSVQTPAMDRLGLAGHGKPTADAIVQDALANLGDGPVRVCDGAEGLKLAADLSSFPRPERVEGMTRGLTRSGLYSPPGSTS